MLDIRLFSIDWVILFSLNFKEKIHNKQITMLFFIYLNNGGLSVLKFQFNLALKSNKVLTNNSLLVFQIPIVLSSEPLASVSSFNAAKDHIQLV